MAAVVFRSPGVAKNCGASATASAEALASARNSRCIGAHPRKAVKWGLSTLAPAAPQIARRALPSAAAGMRARAVGRRRSKRLVAAPPSPFAQALQLAAPAAYILFAIAAVAGNKVRLPSRVTRSYVRVGPACSVRVECLLHPPSSCSHIPQVFLSGSSGINAPFFLMTCQAVVALACSAAFFVSSAIARPRTCAGHGLAPV